MGARPEQEARRHGARERRREKSEERGLRRKPRKKAVKARERVKRRRRIDVRMMRFQTESRRLRERFEATVKKIAERLQGLPKDRYNEECQRLANAARDNFGYIKSVLINEIRWYGNPDFGLAKDAPRSAFLEIVRPFRSPEVAVHGGY